MAVDEARRVLKSADFPMSSKQMIEDFAHAALADLFYNSQKFFLERSIRKDNLAISASVFSHFSNSATGKRFLEAVNLVEQAETVYSSKPEDLKQYLELIVNAYLMEYKIFSCLPVDASQTKMACDVVAGNYPSTCEDLLIGKILILDTNFSPEYVMEATSLAIEASRIMKLGDVSRKVRRLKLAKLHCLTACILSVSGRYDTALDNFSQALQLGHDDDVLLALSGQAFCYLQKGDLDQSKDIYLDYLKKAPRCDTSFARNLYFLAGLSLKQQNWDEACYYYEQAMEAEMDRLPFLEEVSVQDKRCLFGLCLATDTSKMLFCNKCFRIEISSLVLTCESCQEVAISTSSSPSSGNGLERIIEAILLKPFPVAEIPNTIHEIVQALKTVGQKLSRINNLLELLTVFPERRSFDSDIPALDFPEIRESATNMSEPRRLAHSAAEIEDGREATKTHGVGVGAAGSLMAVSLVNPPDSAVKEVLSTGERLLSKAGDSERSSTYAGSGASGQVAIAIKYEAAEENKSVFSAPARNRLFTGRVEILEKLNKALCIYSESSTELGRESDYTTNNTQSGCKLAALSGLGGTGKTSVAVEYAWQNKDIYSGGCYWLSVDDLEGSILGIASRVAKPNVNSSTSLPHQLRCVLDYLSALTSLWLLVVDNMDVSELPRLLYTILLGPWRQWSNRGSLLVTSRYRPDVLEELLHIESRRAVIVLDEFQESESLQFLEHRTLTVKDEIEFSAKEASVLACKLGHLPLALDQAASYLLFTKCSLKDYVATYKKQCVKLLKRRKATRPLGDDKSASHRFAVHTTWQMNFDRIANHQEFGTCASLFVQVTAFVAPEKIPFALLRATDMNRFVNDSTALRSIVSLLTELSLFREESSKWLAVHRLVQSVLQDEIRQQSEKLHVALRSAINALVSCIQASGMPNLVDQAMRETVGKQEDWGVLASHALVLQEHVFSSALSLGKEFYQLSGAGLAFLLNNAAIYASAIGRQPIAKEMDYQKLRVLDMMDGSLSDDVLVKLASTIIPLPLKVQQNVRRAIGDKTMTGTSDDDGIREPKRSNFSSNGTIEKSSRELRNDWMESLRNCDFATAQDAVCRMSADLLERSVVANSKAFGERFVLLSCRARAHLRCGNLHGAVKDAHECIEMGPGNSDGYEILAEVFALIKCSSVPLARCMAAVATFLKSESSTMAWFQKVYSNIEVVRVTTKGKLQSILSNQKQYRGHTLLLDDFDCLDLMYLPLIMTESINFVGLRRFTFRLTYNVVFVRGNLCLVNADIFSTNDSVVVAPEASACFIHSCISSNSARCPAISLDGSAYFDRCQISDSDAGGLLVSGVGIAIVFHSLIKGNKTAGLEARYGGSLTAVQNTVCENGGGFLLGPIPGDCLIQSNSIFMNKQGIEISHTQPTNIDSLFGDQQVTDCLLSMPLQKPSVSAVIIEKNEVCGNTTYGIYLHCVTSRLGVVAVRKNLINENMFWGFGSNDCCDPDPVVGVVVEGNVIRGNRCGAIRLRFAGIRSHRITDNVVEKNAVAFNSTELAPSVIEKYESLNTIGKNTKTLHYPHPQGVWHTDCCSCCHSFLGNRKGTHPCHRCYASFYCSKSCFKTHSSRHRRLCELIRSRYSATTAPWPLSETLNELHIFVRTALNREHRRGPAFAPLPQVGGCRFVVKLQTEEEKESIDTPLVVYDQSQTVSTKIVNAQLFDLIFNCGVLGEFHGTSKKVFCWAVLEDIETLRIFFHELAPYTDEW